ncbi:E3 ubiquitin-protein ligase DTX3L [Mustelus asterias]
MEVFPEVRAIIDLTIFKDKAAEAFDIIQLGKSLEKCQNCLNSYEVIDSFEKINEIHTELTKLKMRPSGAESTRSSGAKSIKSSDSKTGRSSGSAETIRSSGTPAYATMSSGFMLTVSATILHYIEMIYGSDLQRIEKDFDVYKRSSSLADCAKIQFIHKKTGVPCEAAIDKFVSRYQSIATNLKLEKINNPGRKIMRKDIEASLQKKFPKVVVTAKDAEFVIIGDPVEVKNAKEFLEKVQFSQFDTCATPNSTNSSRRPPSTSECKTNSNSAAARSKLESKDEDTTCPICLEEIEVRETLKCKHSFCKECINVAFKTKSACPICGEVYGEIRGNQPEGGKMTFRNLLLHLPGYEKFDSIEIHYMIPDGVQGVEHPNPGQRYYGTTRTAYLPDNPEGRKVCNLLRRAFDQRLIFTVGTSSTTGRSNVVTWNDIHHKTNTTGGPSMFGYPDPTYLARVQDELKAKGIC